MTRTQLLACLWTVAMLLACWTPGRYLNFLESASPSDFPTDKLAHFLMFAGFAALWTRAGTGGWSTVRVFVIGTVLAAGTELIQGLQIVSRDPDVLDSVADFVGVLLGICVPPGSPAESPGMMNGETNLS